MIKTAIAFMLGCVLFLQLSQIPNTLWFWASVPALLLLIHRRTRLIAIVLFGMIWTMLYSYYQLDSKLAAELEGNDLVITGTIADIPQVSSNRLRFIFEPDQSDLKLPEKLRLNWYKPLPKQLRSGERWQLTVRLKRIHGMANPGSFDYESWLFQQGIGATGYVRLSEENTRLSASSDYSINTIRQSLAKKIAQYLSASPNRGLIEGLTIGIRDDISPQQWQTLRVSGTSHLLAISGLHIGLAATIGFFLFRRLWSLRAKNLLLVPAIEFAALGGFLFALFYAALAGFSIPTQRALLMVAVVLIGIIIRHPATIPSLLASSMLVILLFDPFAVLSAGFWLSFSAVGLIVYLSQNRFPRLKWQWLKIHGLLALGLSPLLLFFFSQTSLISPIANLIAVPFISLIIVPILLLANLMLSLYESLGAGLLHLADSLLSLFWPVLHCLASLPYASYSINPLPHYYLVVLVLATLLLLTPRGFPAKWLAIIALLPLALFAPDKPDKNNTFWFTLLDVGQGLSAVVQTHSHVLVFDAGAKFSDQFDIGSAIVAPFLHTQGISHIDTLVISHGDNDHIGGALPLMKKIAVSSVMTSNREKLPNSAPCYAGQSWQWDGISFEVLNPQKNAVGSTNNRSCVLKVSNEHTSLLLTGDIEKPIEQRLVKTFGTSLNSTVLIAPHHGSNTSSSTEFLQTVKPDIALISAGYRNRYHFPHNKVMERYRQNKIISYNTAKSGAISIKFERNRPLKVISWREINRKVWTSSN